MRTVVVTGASSGIGKATALRLDRDGWRVYAGVRREGDAECLRTEASERLTPIVVDVTDLDAIKRAAEQVGAAVGNGGLQGLVNNAGVATGGVLEFVALDEMRRVFEVNVIGQLAMTQAMLPLLRRGRGRIVMMSSIAGRSALPLLGPYAASKYALEALTDALRLELRPWGVQVVSVQPGTVDTPIWGKTVTFAEQALRAYPAQAMTLYGGLVDAMLRGLRRIKGAPVEMVARAVVAALTVGTPRTRYVVGRDAALRVWIERLPDRLRDRVLLARLPRHEP